MEGAKYVKVNLRTPITCKPLLDGEDINMVFGRGLRKSIRNRFCGLMGTIREVEEESKYGKC